MSIDVPPWISHEGQSLYSIDVDEAGQRIATAGSDTNVKVWSMLPVLSTAAEQDEAHHPKELATLSEHTAPVNTVRFSKSGKQLATCSDDKMAYVFQLQPGPGRAVFGSAPSLENWKVTAQLRGHSNNVIDVEWSADDTLLATCSLDNTVIIWSSTGRQVAVLSEHESYVKGVAWDPIGSYLATQSDDRSVLIWRCSDWSKLGRITAPFQQGYTTKTFSLRLSWSPDGQTLMAANSFQSPSHCACVLSREDWDSDKSLSIVGHKAPVTAICFHPFLFKDPDDDSDPACCFALGSQDSKVTVWVTTASRPKLVLARLFSQSVMDLAWTGDGLTLAACSTDGQVSVVRFAPGALGDPLGPADQKAVLSRLYGDKRRSKVLLPESAAQLDLEMRHQKPGRGSPKDASKPDLQRALQPARGANLPQPARAAGKAPERIGKGVSARLGGANATGLQAGGPVQTDGTPDRTEFPATRGGPSGNRAGKPPRRISTEMVHDGGQGTPVQHLKPQASQQQIGLGYRSLQNPPSVQRAFTVRYKAEALPGEGPSYVQLDIMNTGATAQLTCSRAGTLLWQDNFPTNVAKAVMNEHFTAIAFHNGALQIFSPAGRQRLHLFLSAPAAFLACRKASWKLFVVLFDGSVALWDLQTEQMLADTKLLPSNGSDVASAQLTENGTPLVLLTDGRALLLHLGLKAWMSIVHPSSAVLPLATHLHSENAGELSNIEAQAMAAAPRAPTAGLLTTAMPKDSLRYLESQIAAALALESPSEYRRWLMTYVRHLSSEQDSGALKELCEELLGPVRAPLDGSTTWQRTVLGLDKRTLLKEVLKEVARHRMHPQLISVYTDLLKAAEEEA